MGSVNRDICFIRFLFLLEHLKCLWMGLFCLLYIHGCSLRTRVEIRAHSQCSEAMAGGLIHTTPRLDSNHPSRYPKHKAKAGQL
jgi:hypothetical protein